MMNIKSEAIVCRDDGVQRDGGACPPAPKSRVRIKSLESSAHVFLENDHLGPGLFAARLLVVEAAVVLLG